MKWDEIRMDHLRVYAGHGVFEKENREGQFFLVNAVLYTQLHQAGSFDDLTLSTHYGEVCQVLHDTLRKQKDQLIEAAAERCVRRLLLQFPLIHQIDLELKKPNAPIGLPFESVSVKISRGWKKAYIGVGSNMGDKQKYIEDAISGLKEMPEIRKVRASSLLVTKPYGGVEQEDFLNGAVELETLFTPDELLTKLQELEAHALRKREIHWGPRTLDLDILFFEEFVSDTKELTVPHPDMCNREFVLAPLNELCPYYLHPLLQKPVYVLLQELRERERMQ